MEGIWSADEADEGRLPSTDLDADSRREGLECFERVGTASATCLDSLEYAVETDMAWVLLPGISYKEIEKASESELGSTGRAEEAETAWVTSHGSASLRHRHKPRRRFLSGSILLLLKPPST